MKKSINIFLLIIGVFVFDGCSFNSVKTDVSSLMYLQDNSKENISSNLKMVSEKIKSVSFNAIIDVEGKEYVLEGEVIVRDDLKESLLHLKYKDNHLYLKNDYLYLSYMHNDMNIIVKDSVEAFSKEIVSLLKFKGVNVKEDKIYNVLSNKWIEDINFDKISEFVEKSDFGYLVEYKGVEVSLDENYLPKALEYNTKNISLRISFKYNPVKISVPVGYDMVNVDVEFIKDLLKVDNIGQLIK